MASSSVIFSYRDAQIAQHSTAEMALPSSSSSFFNWSSRSDLVPRFDLAAFSALIIESSSCSPSEASSIDSRFTCKLLNDFWALNSSHHLVERLGLLRDLVFPE